MCGRYTLSTPGERLGEVFGVEESLQLEPRFNIAPTQSAPVILADSRDSTRAMRMFRWGLVPYWADELSIGNRMINARAETVDRKPAYRDSFSRKRCLVAADGFYEWKRVGRHKQPFFFGRVDGEAFAMAGIWSRWNGADEPVDSFALITTEANTAVAEVHDRMPVILEPSDWAIWLRVESADTDSLKGVLRPAADDLLTSYPVSTFVNSPGNDSSRCVEALRKEELDGPAGSSEPDTDFQGRLF